MTPSTETGSKNETSIVFMRKLWRTSQHGTQNVKAHTGSKIRFYRLDIYVFNCREPVLFV
jgi:hypothetical protein